MLAAIIAISLGLLWPGFESHWLTIRLESYESLKDYDKRILAGMERLENVLLDVLLEDNFSRFLASKSQKHKGTSPIYNRGMCAFTMQKHCQKHWCLRLKWLKSISKSLVGHLCF